MSDEASPYYNVGDQLVDAWGNPAPEGAGEEEADAVSGYADWSAADLKAEVKSRGLTVDGKSKAAYAAALDADDEADEAEEEQTGE